MNLLEHHIVEIHSETPVRENNFEGIPTDYVNVEVTVDCWGNKERKSRQFERAEWDEIKIKGSFIE